MINVEEHRQVPPSLYGSRSSGSIGRALQVAIRTTQARGVDAASREGNPGRLIYRLDEYEVRKRTLKASFEQWGVCLLAPMVNAAGDQVDALGVAGLDGSTDLLIALRLLAERFKCDRMEILERFFPEINNHLMNNRSVKVVTSLTDFRLLVDGSKQNPALYGPLYYGLVLGALAQPGWMAGGPERLGSAGGIGRSVELHLGTAPCHAFTVSQGSMPSMSAATWTIDAEAAGCWDTFGLSAWTGLWKSGCSCTWNALSTGSLQEGIPSDP